MCSEGCYVLRKWGEAGAVLGGWTGAQRRNYLRNRGCNTLQRKRPGSCYAATGEPPARWG
jgi:hypothetical protein